MSEYADAKRHFYIDAVVHGLTSAADFKQVYPLGCAIEPSRMERWLKKFRTPIPLAALPNDPRLVNHFMLGADPEFMFVSEEGDAIHANTLRLRTGLFAGADMNGRLVEVRPAASRFALSVLGSVLESLRFLARIYPATQKYQWQAGAYKFHDGLGGHVHFGRKRHRKKLRKFVDMRRQYGGARVPRELSEVTRLDRMMAAMLAMKCYPVRECELRASQAQGGHYGQPGDVRLQSHGYEYRTFPSWLDNPWLAYFTLVASKLIVQDPDLYRAGFGTAEKTIRVPEQLYNLLCYYKGVDDDAAIALLAYQQHGWPKHHGGDFRGRWGINESLETLKVDVYPQYVPPAQASLDGLFEYLVQGKKIPVVNLEPTWEAKLPAGYELLLPKYETTHVHGYGELLTDLVEHSKHVVGVRTSDNYETFSVSTALDKQMGEWRKQAQAMLPGVQCGVHGGDGLWNVRVGRKWRENPDNLVLIRKFLTSGLFPLWLTERVTDVSYEQWEKRVTQETKPAAEVKIRGSEVFRKEWE